MLWMCSTGKAGPQNFPRKPDPVGLLTTIEELGSTPARTVYIGDSPATSTWLATPAVMRSAWIGAITTRPISPPKAGNPTCS